LNFEATTVLACFEKLKRRFKLIERSMIISYISLALIRKRIFNLRDIEKLL